MNLRLESAINRLMLPITLDSAADVTAAIADALDLPPDDINSPDLEDELALEVERLTTEWIATGELADSLGAIIRSLLDIGADEDLRSTLVAQYADIVNDLQVKRGGNQGWDGLPLQTARRLMSRTPLIVDLLRKQRMSATQVSRLLVTWEPSISVHLRVIVTLARRLGIEVGQDYERTAEVNGGDKQRAEETFPDGDLSAACERAVELIQEFAPDDNWSRWFGTLFDLSGGQPENNYLQVLHTSLLSLDDWDHPPAYLYEFSPRGAAAGEVQGMYPVSTNNAALNLSKSVYRLDDSWARSKSSASAQATVDVLAVLESLPYSARRETARLIRSLLHRYLELQVAPQALLPSPTSASVRSVVDALRVSDTSTRGVVEQRVMDACLSAWWSVREPQARSRGIGDAVNASNFSRRKLGDLEFQQADDRRLTVYEIHGGVLTSPYVHAHRISFERGLSRRLDEEWGSIADPSEWHIDVVYVAHGIRGLDISESFEVQGVHVAKTWLTFDSMLTSIVEEVPNNLLVASFEKNVHAILNGATASHEQRARFAKLAGLELQEVTN